MSRLPLDQVDAFVTAARLRNLTRAAEAMHLTVSALSHRMRLLEQRLGHKLLARGPGRSTPSSMPCGAPRCATTIR